MPECTDDIERRVTGVFDELGIEFEVLACDPDNAKTAAFCRR